jgi:ATP-dependent protease Clp ATPase subunit
MSVKKSTIIDNKILHCCDFCGIYDNEVDVMIAGPDVDICASCVDLCTHLVKEQRLKKASKKLKNE